MPNAAQNAGQSDYGDKPMPRFHEPSIVEGVGVRLEARRSRRLARGKLPAP